jgi:hypothetical protein
MGIFDIFSRNSSTEESVAKIDEKLLLKDDDGRILVSVMFPANTSEFPDYVISNIVKIVEKGYPFLKLIPVREPTGQEITSRYDVQKGYSVADDLYNVEIILKILDLLAKQSHIPKIILILKKGIYSQRESLPNVPWVFSKSSKYGVVVSLYPLEYTGYKGRLYDATVKRFAVEYQIDVGTLSMEELYTIYWLSVLIFHELGHAFGLSNRYGLGDIMCRPTCLMNIFDRKNTMPESGPALNENLKNLHLKELDSASPLFHS